MTDAPLQSMQLIRAAQTGDDSALDQLISRYYDRVLDIVRIRMSPKLRRRLDSTDLVQDSLLAAVRDFEKFEVRDEASLIHWLRRVVENRIIDAARHQERDQRDVRREVSLAGESDSGETVAADFADLRTRPLDGLLRSERQSDLLASLDSLKESQRDLIVLRDFEGHSWARVAELTGRASPDAARVAHREVISHLAVHLAEHRHGGAGD